MQNISFIKSAISRREFFCASALAASAFAAPRFALAAEPEKKSVTIETAVDKLSDTAASLVLKGWNIERKEFKLK